MIAAAARHSEPAAAVDAATRRLPTRAGLISPNPTDATHEVSTKRKVRKFDSLSAATKGPTTIILRSVLQCVNGAAQSGRSSTRRDVYDSHSTTVVQSRSAFDTALVPLPPRARDGAETVHSGAGANFGRSHRIDRMRSGLSRVPTHRRITSAGGSPWRFNSRICIERFAWRWRRRAPSPATAWGRRQARMRWGRVIAGRGMRIARVRRRWRGRRRLRKQVFRTSF